MTHLAVTVSESASDQLCVIKSAESCGMQVRIKSRAHFKWLAGQATFASTAPVAFTATSVTPGIRPAQWRCHLALFMHTKRSGKCISKRCDRTYCRATHSQAICPLGSNQQVVALVGVAPLSSLVLLLLQAVQVATATILRVALVVTLCSLRMVVTVSFLKALALMDFQGLRQAYAQHQILEQVSADHLLEKHKSMCVAWSVSISNLSPILFVLFMLLVTQLLWPIRHNQVADDGWCHCQSSESLLLACRKCYCVHRACWTQGASAKHCFSSELCV